MKSLLTLVAAFLVASVALAEQSPKYSFKSAEAYSDEWVAVAKNITIKEFRFRDTPWRDILTYLEKASKEGDTAGKGISIFIPDEFKAEFEPIAASQWTVQLSDNLNILTVFIEAPPPDWFYFPVAPRKIAVIPQRVLIREIQTPKE
jgi:hypothetical protein